MALRLGDLAPDFTAETTEGTIKFHEWLGNGWGILFSHPRDYTPVCTTELGAVAKMKQEFDKRNVKMAAISVDPLNSHKGWINDINETQNATMNFPVIADPDKKVAGLYDMIHPNADDTFTVRSVFVIGPDKKIKLKLISRTGAIFFYVRNDQNSVNDGGRQNLAIAEVSLTYRERKNGWRSSTPSCPPKHFGIIESRPRD